MYSASEGSDDGFIDLRSDTVTRPTASMRAAMADAVVGDDVYGEDPTVRELESEAAALFGHEAALYCPSGTMCNQIALKVLTTPGSEVIVESESHLLNLEGGAGAVFGHVQFRGVATARGQLTPADLERALRPHQLARAGTELVVLEQTHNRRGGTCYTSEELGAVRAFCNDADVRLFMDGARVFNAAVAQGVPVAEFASTVDMLAFCTSKGLGAPMGSLLVGSAPAIEQARRWRVRFGGAMRQVGVVAAASLVALREMPGRLAVDHDHARALASAIDTASPGIVDMDSVQTNIVVLENVSANAVLAAFKARGVLVSAMDSRTVRFVTHGDVSADQIASVVDLIPDAFANAFEAA